MNLRQLYQERMNELEEKVVCFAEEVADIVNEMLKKDVSTAYYHKIQFQACVDVNEIVKKHLTGEEIGYLGLGVDLFSEKFEKLVKQDGFNFSFGYDNELGGDAGTLNSLFKVVVTATVIG